MERRAILGFPSTSGFFTLSGGSWQSDYPITQLQMLPLSYVARTVDLTAANTVIEATSTEMRRVGLIALPRHNFSLSAQIRVRLYSDSGMTSVVYDSGLYDVWPEVYPWGVLEWEDDNWWTGKYLDSDIAGAIWQWIWVGAQNYLAQAIRIDIADPGNADSYIQAGYLEIAAQYEVTYNFDFGANYGHRYRSVSTEALGGAKYFDARTKPRTFKGSFTLPRDEALTKHFELHRQFDLYRPIIWLPHPDEEVHWMRTAMLAQLTDPGLFAYQYIGLDQVPIALEEIIG